MLEYVSLVQCFSILFLGCFPAPTLKNDFVVITLQPSSMTSRAFESGVLSQESPGSGLKNTGLVMLIDFVL